MPLCRESLPRVLSVSAATLATLLVSVACLLAMASAASARIVIVPGSAPGGGTETFAVRVANERDVPTTRAELAFPADVVVPTVEVAPVDGWTATVAMRPLDTPVTIGDQEFDEAVASIVWEGGTVAPHTFEQFLVTAGPLPAEGRLVLAATQHYEDGAVEQWADPAPSPGAPGAPTVDLVPSPDAAPADPTTTAAPAPGAPAAPAGPADAATTTAGPADEAGEAAATGSSSGPWGWVLIALAVLLAGGTAAGYWARRARTAPATEGPDDPDDHEGPYDPYVGGPGAEPAYAEPEMTGR